ncbi:tetratricopeptide repeat protein [Phanerochaete sordida]|uniref:ER membrane protein complex subunit 2 n=1 Tax=Phanerochaete sordida TaxID=48140 RepID=A0A9P3GEM5_9APHY|nr:tetratricopeptide repeat protein [Phanerochaete sordida]
MEFTAALQKLGGYQPRSSLKAKETLKTGVAQLRSGTFPPRGDNGFETAEGLFLAALDEGDVETAQQCLEILVNKFPESPRVDCLTGILMEAKESPDDVLNFYTALLEADSSNAAIWRRKAGVLRRKGKIDQAVEELCALLDTFYTEVEAWLELADIYSSCQQYTHALQTLSHALLLAPQNPLHVLHFAETAYLVPDIPLALKMFLQAVDMTDDDEQDGISPADTVPTGLALRAWFGVKLCTHKLVTEPKASNSPSQIASPTANVLASLDDLATERLRTAYLETTRESPPTAGAQFIEAVARIIPA